VRFLREHPVIGGVLLACTLAGAAGGLVLADPDWALWRRLIGGAVCGAGVGLAVTATKIVGE